MIDDVSMRPIRTTPVQAVRPAEAPTPESPASETPPAATPEAPATVESPSADTTNLNESPEAIAGRAQVRMMNPDSPDQAQQDVDTSRPAANTPATETPSVNSAADTPSAETPAVNSAADTPSTDTPATNPSDSPADPTDPAQDIPESALPAAPKVLSKAEFDEKTYLEANPDVAKAIANGGWAATAYQHYTEYGVKEGRPMTPTPPPETETEAEKREFLEGAITQSASEKELDIEEVKKGIASEKDPAKKAEYEEYLAGLNQELDTLKKGTEKTEGMSQTDIKTNRNAALEQVLKDNDSRAEALQEMLEEATDPKEKEKIIQALKVIGEDTQNLLFIADPKTYYALNEEGVNETNTDSVAKAIEMKNSEKSFLEKKLAESTDPEEQAKISQTLSTIGIELGVLTRAGSTGEVPEVTPGLKGFKGKIEAARASSQALDNTKNKLEALRVSTGTFNNEIINTRNVLANETDPAAKAELEARLADLLDRQDMLRMEMEAINPAENPEVRKALEDVGDKVIKMVRTKGFKNDKELFSDIMGEVAGVAGLGNQITTRDLADYIYGTVLETQSFDKDFSKRLRKVSDEIREISEINPANTKALEKQVGEFAEKFQDSSTKKGFWDGIGGKIVMTAAIVAGTVFTAGALGGVMAAMNIAGGALNAASVWTDNKWVGMAGTALSLGTNISGAVKSAGSIGMKAFNIAKVAVPAAGAVTGNRALQIAGLGLSAADAIGVSGKPFTLQSTTTAGKILETGRRTLPLAGQITGNTALSLAGTAFTVGDAAFNRQPKTPGGKPADFNTKEFLRFAVPTALSVSGSKPAMAFGTLFGGILDRQIANSKKQDPGIIIQKEDDPITSRDLEPLTSNGIEIMNNNPFSGINGTSGRFSNADPRPEAELLASVPPDLTQDSLDAYIQQIENDLGLSFEQQDLLNRQASRNVRISTLSPLLSDADMAPEVREKLLNTIDNIAQDPDGRLLVDNAIKTNVKIEVSPPETMGNAVGRFSSVTNKLRLLDPADTMTLLHEMVHAADDPKDGNSQEEEALAETIAANIQMRLDRMNDKSALDFFSPRERDSSLQATYESTLRIYNTLPRTNEIRKWLTQRGITLPNIVAPSEVTGGAE